jgi:D-alanyl-D-alanine carboxypeptidase
MTSYVLTAEIASGRVTPQDMVVVSENAWSQNPVFNGSSLMWIEPGKDVSIEDLHRGIVISSGNDSTVAVAEHLAGNESAFADMMNGYAEALGMTDSYFVNSHGLPAQDHLTTARDLATLAQALISRFPEDYELYKEPEFTYNNIRQYNRNTLMGEDASVDGLKTGYTKEAGYCLVASAERRGMRLISVVLGTSSTNARKNETRSLLNYGFRFFETATLQEGGLGLTVASAAAIYGLYTGCVYFMGLPGGWIADRLIGGQKAIWYGGIIIMLGHIILAIPSDYSFFIGLIFVVLGILKKESSRKTERNLEDEKETNIVVASDSKDEEI